MVKELNWGVGRYTTVIVRTQKSLLQYGAHEFLVGPSVTTTSIIGLKWR